MKQVIQLDSKNYYVGVTEADESPLEPGVYLLPAGCIDVAAPIIPDGYVALWADGWVYEPIPEPPVPEPIDPLVVCATSAKVRLSRTDWAVLPDVGLLNVDEYTVYRAAIRSLVLNPVASPVWPDEPQPKWE